MSRGSADPALAAAIEWMVLLRSGDATASDAARHREWQQSDPRHAAAWAQVSGALARSMEPLRSAAESGAAHGVAVKTALARPTRRRALRAGLGMAGVGIATGWLVQRQWPVTGLLADFRTGTGERRHVLLQDGSRVVLNARTALDVRLDDVSRQLRLREGECIVSVAPDAARPFVVHSAQGSVRALGTRFLVRQDETSTLALVLEHSVQIQTAGGIDRTLHEGEAVRFSDLAVDAAQNDAVGLASWERGMLSVNDRPLGDVVDALRSYRRGVIRVSPEAARLRVLGAFPLDDTDRALESLAQTLPIRVSRYGPWWVAIDLRT